MSYESPPFLTSAQFLQVHGYFSTERHLLLGLSEELSSMEVGALVGLWASAGKTAGCWEVPPALGLEGSLPSGRHPRAAVSWNRVRGNSCQG